MKGSDAKGVREEAEDFWEPMTTGRALLVLGTMAVLAGWRAARGDGWVPVIDWANAVFHEAGHVLFGVMGPKMKLHGGVLGQLAFPLVTTWLFWIHRGSRGFALCAAWLCENLLGLARAMAGAGQELPLVGAREHDWPQLLAHWGLLERQAELASKVHALGVLGISAVAVWTAWRWYRERLASAPIREATVR